MNLFSLLHELPGRISKSQIGKGWPQRPVKSLDFRQGSDIFRFLLEKDHVCCCLEKGLRGSRQWEQSELRVTEEAGWMRKGGVQ